MQAVVETPDFLRDAKTAGIGDDERRSIVDHVAANPKAGDLIVGSGGARKIRFAAPGRGKSGGFRVVTYWRGRHPGVSAQRLQEGRSGQSEQGGVNALREELSHLAREYREGVMRYVKGR